MKVYVNNQLEEIDPPSFPAPVQGWEERMNLDEPKPLTAGVLSEAHKAILAESKTLDRREFDYLLASGQGMAAAFKACASTSRDGEVAELCKSFGKQPVKAQVRIERDKLDDGSYSVTEYDAQSGALLRFWVDTGDGKPAQMRQ